MKHSLRNSIISLVGFIAIFSCVSSFALEREVLPVEAAYTQPDHFIFSRNGITWQSTWNQVMEAEYGTSIETYTEPEFPFFKDLAVYDVALAGMETQTLNYLFYNKNLLAILYEFRPWNFGPDYRKYKFVTPERDAGYDTLSTSMVSKYGNPLPTSEDWVEANLQNLPELVMDVFDLEISEHSTWQISKDTIAFTIKYNQHGDFALIYLNMTKMNELGFGDPSQINIDGI